MKTTLTALFGLLSAIFLVTAYGQNHLNKGVTSLGKLMTTYAYSGVLKSEDARYLSQIETAGRSADRSKLQSLIVGLRNPKHSAYPYALMCAASRMGATEVLPEFERYSKDDSFANYTRVCRCRLLAEAAVKDLPVSQQAPAKINRFYSELGLNVSDINAALIRNNQSPTGITFIFGDSVVDSNAEVYAIQAISDMAYQDDSGMIAMLPNVKGLRFDLDYPSELKIRLSSLSRHQRIATLVEELASKTAYTSDIDYDITLLADEGPLGSNAALAKLTEMSKNPSLYHYHTNGYLALFRVVQAVADPSQAPLVQSLKQYPVIGESADQLYQDVLAGRKQLRKVGY